MGSKTKLKGKKRGKKGRKQKEEKTAECKKQYKEEQGRQLLKIWWGRGRGKIGQE